MIHKILKVLFCILVIFCAIYIYNNWQYFLLVSTFPIKNLIGMLLASISLVITNTKLLSITLKSSGYSTNEKEVFIITCYSSLLGYVSFLRVGNISSKLLYLKALYSIPMSASAGAIGFISIIMIFINSLFGLFITAIMHFNDTFIPHYFFMIFASGITCSIILFSILKNSYLISLLPGRYQVWFNNIKNVISKCRNQYLLYIVLLSFCSIFFQTCGIYFLFSGFGINLNLPSLLLASVFGNLSLIIAITPSNVGIKESLFALVFAPLGVTPALMVSAMLFDRVIQFFVLIFTCLLGIKTIRLPTINSTK